MEKASAILQEAEGLAAAGSFDLACEKYLAAHQAAPEDVDIAIKAGSYLLEREEPKKAYAVFQDAAFYQPENPKVFALMGLTMISLGRKDEAQICLQRAINLNPQDEASKTLLTGLQQEQASGQDLDRAVETFKMILEHGNEPGVMEDILKRVDSTLLAVVRANAATAREDGNAEMADSLDELANNLEDIIVRRILEE